MPLDCLVNLNARVYDPVLGRFMTGDPVISSVYDQQALNRYSYVHNNPLSFTDVTGECGPFCIFLINVISDLIVAEALKPVFIHNPILGDLWIIADAISCQLCAAEDAGVLAGVKSGNVGKAVEAFVLNYAESEAFKEVGDIKTDLHLSGIAATATSFVLHGAVGGTFSVLQGGQFGSGFLSAGISDLASPYIMENSKGNVALGAAESAVVGGTTSVIGGGSFGNGAITGAFGYLFNDAAHDWGKAGAGLGAVGGAAAVAGAEGACVGATGGACAADAPLVPGAVVAGAAAGAAGGYAAGSAAGTVADEIVVIANRVNANSSSSMQGTELYYLINRTSGSIDKIGVTSYPGQRYPQSYLNAENVDYVTQYYFQWRYAAYAAENIELMGYFATHGQFPRLNCCAR
jgi:RHS repeat-associated protein